MVRQALTELAETYDPEHRDPNRKDRCDYGHEGKEVPGEARVVRQHSAAGRH